MTGPDVPHGDMPNFPWSGRRDVPPLEDTALAALLGEGELPAGAAAAARPLADLLTALTAAPERDELAGEAAALAVFRRRDSLPAPAPPPRRRVFAPLLSLRAGLVAGAVAASLSGVAAAAYTGSLPLSLQRIAHVVIGAPAPGGVPTSTRSGSPSPTSLAGARLCAAYQNAEATGTAAERAAAFGRLAAAAGGAAKVTAFCDAAGHPGVSPSPGTRTRGKPTSHPTAHPHPTPTHASPHPHPTHPPHPTHSPHPTHTPHPTPSHPLSRS